MNERVLFSTEARLDPAGRKFLRAHPEGMLYHSEEWLSVIARQTGCEILWLVARSGSGEPRALWPLCFRNGPLGRIVNSSAYFGSHGGCLADSPATFRSACAEFLKTAKDLGAVAGNVIMPLFSTYEAEYRACLSPVLEDSRLGQYIDLDAAADREALFNGLEGLVRSNLKRKSWKAGFEMGASCEPSLLMELAALHAAEMSAKPGGNPKSREFFSDVAEMLPAGAWTVYFARKGPRLAAGLLVIFWGDCAEYICPAFDSEFREGQPGSAVLWEALVDAKQRGLRRWNFGGTWPSQDGVRAFKKSWGAFTCEYRYFVVDLGGVEALRSKTPAWLQANYPGFYAVPFSECAKDATSGAVEGPKEVKWRAP